MVLKVSKVGKLNVHTHSFYLCRKSPGLPYKSYERYETRLDTPKLSYECKSREMGSYGFNGSMEVISSPPAKACENRQWVRLSNKHTTTN